jgi:hypothetical protein
MRKPKGVAIVLFAVFCPVHAFAQATSATKASTEDASGFKRFSAKVQRYVELHRRIEKTVPKLKNTSSPQSIAAHQQELAQKIQQARTNAREGEIFQPAAQAFRHAIEREFQGSEAKNARATIQQGEPIKNVRLGVNQVYPKDLPYTSVPPTLLLKLPKLPDGLAYRIVDHDLVLLDVKANLVVDLIPEPLP